MKFYLLICLFFSLQSIGNVFGQVTVHDVTFAETYNAENNKLILNGAGIRKKGPIDLYVAGLYMRAKSTDANKIIEAGEPMAIRIVITSGMITSKKMDKTIREGFSKSTGGNTNEYQDRIDKFANALSENIAKGVRYDLIFLPDKNITTVLKNDQSVTEINGLDFKKILFKIWLGDDPVDDALKKKMLGE